MVLGVEWPRSLGEVKVNWDELTMKFMIGKEERSIKGDPSLVKTLMSLKFMLRNLKKGRQGYLIEVGQMLVEQVGEEIPIEIQGLLNQFRAVHEPTQDLPLMRVKDHAIEIKQGEQPPNIRSYRYLHSQKAVIERLVNEMLIARVICPSSSPYSSLG